MLSSLYRRDNIFEKQKDVYILSGVLFVAPLFLKNEKQNYQKKGRRLVYTFIITKTLNLLLVNIIILFVEFANNFKELFFLCQMFDVIGSTDKMKLVVR